MENKISYQGLCEEEARLEKWLESVRNLKQNYSSNGAELLPFSEKKVIRPDKIKAGDQPYYDVFDNLPDKYDKEFTQIQKTLFTLKKAKQGLVPDLAKILIELDNDLSLKKAKEIVTYHCSKFYNLRLINAHKIGNKNKYFI